MTHGSNHHNRFEPATTEELTEYYMDEMTRAFIEGRNPTFGHEYSSVLALMLSARALDNIDANIQKIVNYMEQGHA